MYLTCCDVNSLPPHRVQKHGHGALSSELLRAIYGMSYEHYCTTYNLVTTYIQLYLKHLLQHKLQFPTGTPFHRCRMTTWHGTRAGTVIPKKRFTQQSTWTGYATHTKLTRHLHPAMFPDTKNHAGSWHPHTTRLYLVPEVAMMESQEK